VTVGLLTSITIWIVNNQISKEKIKPRSIITILIGSGVVLMIFNPFKYLNKYATISNAPFGLVDFYLSPAFFQIDSNFLFLFIPAILHWIFFPLTVYGILRLLIECEPLRLPIFYFLIMSLIYAMGDHFALVRMRYQFTFILSISQYYALWYGLTAIKFKFGKNNQNITKYVRK
jgi:CDP-diglyceride synthetase